MARIRSVKPEFWTDPRMGRLGRDARLLYIALWNLADEHGRLLGDPRFLKGQTFPYDDDMTPEAIARLLAELHRAGRVRPYSVNGDAYLYVPTLGRHQRLEAEKVPSRHPSPDDADKSAPVEPARADKSAPRADERAPRGADQSALLYGAGSMEHGSATRGAPAPRADPLGVPETTQALIARWIEGCVKRPPGEVINRLGKHIKKMLEDGIDPVDINRGLEAWARKGLDPSTLPSVVNEVMNSGPATSRQQEDTNAMFDRALERARARDAARESA